ncbi:MAG: aminoglycoside phosphotransferase family protein [Myxococcota bacterium]|nr:aminoglycoside phosphotransferase family protein [Myxococcota bacterium]
MDEKPPNELKYLTAFRDETALLNWVRRVYPVQSLEFFDGGHEQSYIWLVRTKTGVTAVLKMHKAHGSARREVDAYRFVERNKLPGTPRLLRQCASDSRILLLSHERGESDQLNEDTVFRAGQFLGSLHRAPFKDNDSVPLVEAFELRFEALRGRIKDPDLHRLLVLFQSKLLKFELGQRVFCHRDFRPENWLSDPSNHRLTVLDFGHCRPGLWLADLIHLRVMTLEQPQLWASFLAGYDRDLTETEYNLLWALIGLYGVATCLRTDQGPDAVLSRGQNYVDLSHRVLSASRP